jgi:hypothetical protein
MIGGARRKNSAGTKEPSRDKAIFLMSLPDYPALRGTSLLVRVPDG